MALALESGTGVAVNLAQAVRYYTAAAEAGNTSAMHNLGLAFVHGRGVERDTAAGIAWWKRAAAAGDAGAAARLAEMAA